MGRKSKKNMAPKTTTQSAKRPPQKSKRAAARSTPEIMDAKKKLTFTKEATAEPDSSRRGKRARSPPPETAKRRSPLYEPPPKKYKPLNLAEQENEEEDEEGFDRMEALYYEQVRDGYSALEVELQHGSQDKTNKLVAEDSQWLTGKWSLYNVGTFYQFLYTSSRKKETFEKCVRRLKYQLYSHLKKKRYTISGYREFTVVFKPFFGFNPFMTDTDETPFWIRVMGKIADGTWEEACSLVMGSIGTRPLECVFEYQGQQFNFYPFIIGRGNEGVLLCVFDYFKKHHDCVVTRQKFDGVDMWRLLSLCLFFAQRIPRRKKHEHRIVHLTSEEEPGVDVTWDFDMSDLMAEIRKRHSIADQDIHFLTTNQVQRAQASVVASYKAKFKPAMDCDAFCLKSIRIPLMSVAANGELEFDRVEHAVAFLFFFSRYRTRKYLYPALNLTMEQVLADAEQTTEEHAQPEPAEPFAEL